LSEQKENYSAEKLRELLREQLNPGLSLLFVEEFARETGAELAKRMPRPMEVVPEKIVTKTLDKKDEPIRYKLDLVKVESRGKLTEVTIRSPSPDFSLLVMTDGLRRIDRSYTDLAVLSPHSETIDAYEDAENGVYILHIKEMSWTKSGLVTLYVDSGAITFQRVWAVWEEFT